MSLRRKIAGLLRRLARAMDDTPRLTPAGRATLLADLPLRRVNRWAKPYRVRL